MDSGARGRRGGVGQRVRIPSEEGICDGSSSGEGARCGAGPEGGVDDPGCSNGPDGTSRGRCPGARLLVTRRVDEEADGSVLCPPGLTMRRVASVRVGARKPASSAWSGRVARERAERSQVHHEDAVETAPQAAVGRVGLEPLALRSRRMGDACG